MYEGAARPKSEIAVIQRVGASGDPAYVGPTVIFYFDKIKPPGSSAWQKCGSTVEVLPGHVRLLTVIERPPVPGRLRVVGATLNFDVEAGKEYCVTGDAGFSPAVWVYQKGTRSVVASIGTVPYDWKFPK